MAGQDCSLEGFKLDDSQEMDDLTFGNVVITAEDIGLGMKMRIQVLVLG